MSTITATVPRNRKPIVPSSVMGMLIFVTTEAMFFTALISAFLVIKKDQITWTIPNNIQLPVETTALNTLVLLASGLLMYLAGKKVVEKDFVAAKSLAFKALILGTTFVVIQSYEWIQLAGFGLSMNSSIFGALFFLIIGCHSLHVLAGLVGLVVTIKNLGSGKMDLADFRAMQMFWFLVVGVWPVLYFLVYF